MIEGKDQNREILCFALHSYIDGLEKMKEVVNSKLQSSEPSPPNTKFTKVEELQLKIIQITSCFEKGNK